VAGLRVGAVNDREGMLQAGLLDVSWARRRAVGIGELRWGWLAGRFVRTVEGEEGFLGGWRGLTSGVPRVGLWG